MQLTETLGTQTARKKGHAPALGYFLHHVQCCSSLNELLPACLSLKAAVRVSPTALCTGSVIKAIAILPWNALCANLGACSLFAGPLAPLGSLQLWILLCLSGGLTFAGSQMPTQLLSLLLNRTAGENKVKKLVGQAKDRESTYQLPSRAKQAQLGDN